MIEKLRDSIFRDENMIRKIKDKLPYMFYLAEKETSKGGKVGMEIGTVREQMIEALILNSEPNNIKEPQEHGRKTDESQFLLFEF